MGDYNVSLFENASVKLREKRTQTISTKMSEEEERQLQRAASAEGKRMGEWVRDALLRAALGSASTSRDQETVVLTEVIGIQLFLMNVLSPLARGENISPEQYQNIIKSVQANKARLYVEASPSHSSLEEPFARTRQTLASQSSPTLPETRGLMTIPQPKSTPICLVASFIG